jgi:hypothetical protein
MSNILEANVELINDRMKFSCQAGENPPIKNYKACRRNLLSGFSNVKRKCRDHSKS